MPTDIPLVPECTDVDGNFENGVLPPWYISDRVTADSSVLEVGDGEWAFALIPSQDSFAQVHLNQLLPNCGFPPPEVTMTVRFDYLFTGASSGCQIQAWVNRNPATDLANIQDDGQSPGVWQSYTGEPIEVQLTFDPLFTIRMACQENTPNVPAILIRDISVY